MEKLTIQEEEAMIYIWELGSCFVKEIVAKYPQPAPYDAYDESDDTEENAKSGFLKGEIGRAHV